MIKFILAVIKRSAANIIVNWIYFFIWYSWFWFLVVKLISFCAIASLISFENLKKKNVTNKKKYQQTNNAKCNEYFNCFDSIIYSISVRDACSNSMLVETIKPQHCSNYVVYRNAKSKSDAYRFWLIVFTGRSLNRTSSFRYSIVNIIISLI